MISVSIDSRAFSKDLSALEKSQLPFATMRMINEIAEGFQAEKQEDIVRKFTVRRPSFIMNTVKIARGHFATKDNLRAIVGIDPERDVLSKFEEDGVKQPMFDGHSLAIPIEARRNKQDIVAAGNRPKAFQLTNQTSGSGKVAKGLKRTFLIKGANGEGGIFQRQGKGKGSSIHLLFALRKSVTIPRNLTFVADAKRYFAAHAGEAFDRWLKQAVRTAR